jgi:hypothetical protein
MDWVPLWNRTLSNRKAQGLSGDVFKTWINLLCLASASKKNGELPEVEQIAFELRLDLGVAISHLTELKKCGLIDVDPDGTRRIHDWDAWQLNSYKSTERVRRHRAKKKRGGTGETFHAVPETACNGLEEKRGEENRRECGKFAPAHAREDFLTGREGEEHALFCRVVKDLEGFEETKYLADSLIMYASTPEIRGYPSWRLFVACRVVQRPNRGKTWDTFCRAAFNATLEEYERMKNGPQTIPINGRRYDGPTNMPPEIPPDTRTPREKAELDEKIRRHMDECRRRGQQRTV